MVIQLERHDFRSPPPGGRGRIVWLLILHKFSRTPPLFPRSTSATRRELLEVRTDRPWAVPHSNSHRASADKAHAKHPARHTDRSTATSSSPTEPTSKRS